MGKKLILVRVLTILGNILIWLPILAPIFFSTIAFVATRQFLFDYLMPAELFPLFLIGAGFLFWVAHILHMYQKFILMCFIIAVSSLILGQVLAVISGLASGDIPPADWPWMLVILSLIVYITALIAIGIKGLLLLKNLLLESLKK